MADLTRRAFVKSSVIAGAAIRFAEIPWPLAVAAEPTGLAGEAFTPSPAPSWVDRPMRWAQLTLVEDDPVKFDLNFWLDYFARTKSDAVCLSAGGCVAYYPTDIRFHHRSAWLGERDVFGELVAGCRKLGMVVIARTDPHATYDDAAQARPDWIAIDATGKPRRHWASPEMWVTCGLGPYNFEFMTEVKREIMTRYRVDGIFINRWDGSGMCFCEHCRKNFRESSGFELPASNNHPQDPIQRAYFLWRQERLFTLWRRWDSAVRAINADSCVIPNTAGGANGPLDMKRIGEFAPTLMADRQARRGVLPPWGNGRSAKEFRSTMGSKPVVGIFSVGLEEPYRWKDSVQNPAEFQLWAIDGIANGMRPWFTKFAGKINDPRWLDPVEKLYGWCAKHERYLRNQRSLARVGLVYSQQTTWFHRSEQGREAVEDAGLGWYHALVEARIPFELVHDRMLSADHLAQFKTLILPNVAALSGTQCAQLRAFVERGGGLVATSETSLYDEWGQQRKDFGLVELFGASFAGKTEGPMHNAYLTLEHERARGNPLLAGLQDAPRTVHGVWRLAVTPHEKMPVAALTLVPSYPDLPMEKVFARQAHTDTPEVFQREIGRGRVIYFPWDIDRTFWEVLDVDHGKLLRNAVTWATNEPPVVEVSGPGVIDVTVWQQEQSFTVHLVNLTNPMMMKGPIRELLPIGTQHVRVRLPGQVQVKSVRLLVASDSPTFRQNHEWIEFTVREIVAHEVVAIEV